MKHVTLTASIMLLAAAHTASAEHANGIAKGNFNGDPKVRVRLSEDALLTGDNAKVKVKTAADGHLIVLRMDSEGRVKVLFPVDPTDQDRVRGGKELEVRGRGDRDAFTVSERAGSGLILAARTDQPFNVAAFVTGDRWNVAAFVPDSGGRDPESALLSIVDRMTGGHFDYDVAAYHVGAPLPKNAYGTSRNAPSRYARYGSWYDPWFSPYGMYDPYYRSGLSFGLGYGGYFPILRPVYRGHGRR